MAPKKLKFFNKVKHRKRKRKQKVEKRKKSFLKIEPPLQYRHTEGWTDRQKQL